AIPARMAVVMLVLFISTLLDRPQGFVLCAATAQLAVHTRLDPVGFGNSVGMLRQTFNQSNSPENRAAKPFPGLLAPRKTPLSGASPECFLQLCAGWAAGAASGFASPGFGGTIFIRASGTWNQLPLTRTQCSSVGMVVGVGLPTPGSLTSASTMTVTVQ